MTTREFATVDRAVEAVADGRIVIVVDSEDRENEGDFVAAAEAVTPEMIHFMISHGRGLVCVPLLPEIAQRLELAPMVAQRGDVSVPRFAVPIDHVTCKTGISPWERSYTIRSVLDPNSQSDDFLRPGHIFPLIAEEVGVLGRRGHTEATVDLARMAGRAPAGILCEVCSRDGMHMACRDELLELGARHNIPVLTIDDLVEYRSRDSDGSPRRLQCATSG